MRKGGLTEERIRRQVLYPQTSCGTGQNDRFTHACQLTTAQLELPDDANEYHEKKRKQPSLTQLQVVCGTGRTVALTSQESEIP
jgi:hypothetical protein